MISDVDVDGCGTFGFEEFLKMTTHMTLNRDPNEEILKAFRLLDDDETGLFSFLDLKRVANELGERMSDEELQVLFDEAARVGVIEVNEVEFLRFRKKNLTSAELSNVQSNACCNCLAAWSPLHFCFAFV